MKHALLALALFFTLSSLRADDQFMTRLTSDSEPLATVAGCVHALSGECFYIEHDLVSTRAGGLGYTRIYDSAAAIPYAFGYGWSGHFPKVLYFLEYEKKKKDHYVFVGSQEHRLFPFRIPYDKEHFEGEVPQVFYKNGYTNTADTLLTEEPPFPLTTVSCKKKGNKKRKAFWTVVLPNGTTRTYKRVKNHIKYLNCDVYRYVMNRETLPNGWVRIFTYWPDSDFLKKIEATNGDGSRVLDTLEFTYKGLSQTLKLANGRQVAYFLRDVIIDYSYPGTVTSALSCTDGDHLLKTFYDHKSFLSGDRIHFKIDTIDLPDKRCLKIKYYDELKKKHYGKVKELKIPHEKGLKTLYAFKYFDTFTEVTDALGNITTFHKENHRLVKVEQENYRSFRYQWDAKGNMLKKDLWGVGRAPLKATHFQYDPYGNPIKKTIVGQIPGNPDNGPSIHTYQYDTANRHLKISETLPNGTRIAYGYQKGTNLITSQLTISQGKIQERTFHTYDDNAILTQTIIDDGRASDPCNLEGATYRLITEKTINLDPNSCGYTQPAAITEYALDLTTGENILLKRKEITYTTGDLIAEEHIFDAYNTYCYTLSYNYDKAGLLLMETNALGEKTHYQYDTNHNLTRKETIGAGKYTQYTYDRNNRLIQEKEILEDGQILATAYTYDIFGNQLTKTDPYGAVTTHTYDAYSRRIQTQDPYGNTSTTQYDKLDQPIKETDPEGNLTKQTLHIFGKPSNISHPDGTKEHFFYTPSGNLAKKIDPAGIRTEYTHDYQDRILSEKTYSPEGKLLKTHHYQYKGKHLIKETDSLGISTHYRYDFAGRLIEKTRQDKEEHYHYDTLGRLAKTQSADRVQIQEYDLLNRVIEKRTEDPQGALYRKTTYAYDINGNITSEKKYTQTNTYSQTQAAYNGLNQCVHSIDPEGNETHYLYFHTDHLHTIKIDPLGQQEHIHYDKRQQISTKELYFQDTLLAKETYQYSPNGHKISQEHQVLIHGIPESSYTIEWEYDSMGREVKQIEQKTKITQTTYKNGRKATITKPDGTTLYHTYDGAGRLAAIRSSDQSIHYTYTYDPLDNLLTVQDLIHQTNLQREYDCHGRITKETLPNGYISTYAYDLNDRLTKITLPDQSTIQYLYNPTDLTTVKRKQKTHQSTYDLAGNIIQEECFNNETIDYTYDKNHRLIQKQSPHFTQHLAYDPVGNIIYTQINQEESFYQYDPLYQLISEEGTQHHTYQYDSLYNRLSKDSQPHHLDELHQLLSTGQKNYTYDPNGNRLSTNTSSYTYDALNRLTAADNITYTYDPFGRLLSRNQERCLHYKEHELGSPELLKIIGRKTLGIEKEGMLYTVITDHRGSICLIMDGQKQAASYTYDAFGASASQGSFKSPWQFCSQRIDPSTHHLHFPKRVYDPEAGRWLTPDPAGFADGPNLYAYVQNNPLKFIDPLGLSKEETHKADQKSTDSSLFYHYSRGFLDDASMGVSNRMLGEHYTPTFSASAAYYTGVATSLVVGAVCGGAYVKGARLGGRFLKKGWDAGRYIYRGRQAAEAAKSTMRARRIARLAEQEMLLETKLFRQKFNFVKEKWDKSLPEGHIWEKASPFRNKTAKELHEMFLEKGFERRGLDPINGRGSYLNPTNKRQYRIDPYSLGRYREPSHVDISRPKGYKGPLGKKRFLYADH